MKKFDFVDWYKKVGIQPSSETIRFRKEAFDKLLPRIDSQMIFTLTRIYYDLPINEESTDWFVDAFRETDPFFSLVDSEREAAILSECLLAGSMENGIIEAGLAVLSASANGNRNTLVDNSYLIQYMDEALAQISLDIRQLDITRLDITDLPDESSASNLVNEFISGTDTPKDFDKVGDIFEKISEEDYLNIKNCVNKYKLTLETMSNKMKVLEEESSILWWCIGGHSKILNEPFSKLKPSLSASMIGIDLGMLTRIFPGPIAIPALIYRLLDQNGIIKTNTRIKPTITDISIKNMIDELFADNPQGLNLKLDLNGINDLCPVLTAFDLSNTIGIDSWESAFHRRVGFTSDVIFKPQDLAAQVYRECILISCLTQND